MAKSKYETHVLPKLNLVESWARDGLTDEQIAKKLGVSESTFYLYKEKYSEFSESLKRNKEIVDNLVVNALLKRALGYEYTETVFEKIDSKVNLEITPDSVITTDAYKKKITIKSVPPDTTAQIFWLKNRQSDKWRDKIDNGDKAGGDITGLIDAITLAGTGSNKNERKTDSGD